MIATLESNSRNYSNWIELDKIFTYSRYGEYLERGVQNARMMQSCLSNHHRVKLSVVPPLQDPSMSLFSSILLFLFDPMYSSPPLERSLPRDLSSLRTRISLHRFISKNVKTTSLSTVSLPSLPSWFPLHFHPEYASLSSCSFSLCWLPTVGKKSKNDSSLGDHAFTFL